MQACTLVEDEALLTAVITTSLGDDSHDWRLMSLVSKRFLAVWSMNTLPVLRWRIAYLENTVVYALESRIDDIKHGCSCGSAVGYHNCL